MYMFIVGNKLHSAFPNTEIPFAYACTSGVTDGGSREVSLPL